MQTGTDWPQPRTTVVERDDRSAWAFGLLLLALAFEFGRPQTMLPIIGSLGLPGLTTLALGMWVVSSGRLSLAEEQTRLFVALLGLMAFHVPAATNNYWALQMAKSTLLNFILYLGISVLAASKDRFWTLMKVWFGIHVYLAWQGIQRGGRGIGGFLGDENDFCMTLNMVLPYTFLLMTVERSRLKQLAYGSMTALFLAAQVTTGSRGGFIGLLAVAAACWSRSTRKVATLVAIGLLAVGVLAAAPESYWNEIRSIKEEGATQGTGEARVYLWTIAWHMFLDNPIIGVGQGNLPYRFRQYEIATGNEDGFYGTSRAGRAAHSLYFTLLPELGLVGGGIYLAMVLRVRRDAREAQGGSVQGGGRAEHGERARMLARATEASLAGFLASGLFISVLYYPNFWVLCGFATALKYATRHDDAHGSSPH